MPEVRALIFDLGNVLHRFDGERQRQNLAALTDGQATAAMIARFEAETATNKIVDTGALDAAALHAAYSSGVGVSRDYAAFAAAWNDVFALQEGIEDLLDRLHGRYPLVILSNTNPIHVDHLRQNLPLLQRFSGRLFSCEIGCAKPAPAAYAAAVALTGVTAAQCLFLDDSQANVDGALACGLQAFRFTTVADAETRLVALGVL